MATSVELPRRGLAGLASRLGLASRPPARALVFCRWADEDFPLAVRVEEPVIHPALEDEIRGHAPGEYVAAVERALSRWEQALEGRVRFRVAAGNEPADLVLRVLGEQAPAPGDAVTVLGSTPLREACRVRGVLVPGRRLEVEFRVPELRIFVADRHGLLLPEQVEGVALHEIGHALGMAGHSPIPADLMYEEAPDRLPRSELGTEDVNSFLSLYAVPPGTVYLDLPAAAVAPVAAAPGPPSLDLAPHVDPRLGYEVQTPLGWTRVDTGRGLVAVDGVTWDFDASFQVIVRRFDSVESYLERHGAWHLGRAPVESEREARIAGCRALRFRLTANEVGLVEEYGFVESGDGRVLVLISEYPAEQAEAYRPVFEAILASLELHRPGGVGDREYAPE
jgi:predicted Zn-dependent protease